MHRVLHINNSWFWELFYVFRLFSAIKAICDIYDWDGKGELDLFFLGDVMYALGMNTTKKVQLYILIG